MVTTHGLSYNGLMKVFPKTPDINLDPLPEYDLAQFCRHIRSQLGLSKEQMAELLDIGYSAYDHYEHGRRDPNGQTTAKLFMLREKLAFQPIEPPSPISKQ